MTTMTMALNETREAVVARDTGLTGRVTVTWAVAGGMLLGGVLVALMTLAGKLSGGGLLVTAAGLYVIGGLLGFVHGAALGFFGRPEDVTGREALGRIGMAAVYALPALIVGFIAAGWIAMTMVALYMDRTLPLVGVAAGWAAGAVVVLLAAANGVRALKNAYARWPDRRLGTVMVGATFTALLVLFLADRPELWGTRFRVTEVGAVLLAAVGAFWVAGPVVTLALALRARLRPAAQVATMPRAAVSLGLGLVVGLTLGVIAVPFQHAAFAAPTVGTVGGAVVLVSRALVDEVLLRLFLVTGVVWALVRWNNTPARRAAVIAIVTAAVTQVGLYLPGVNAIGFPTATAAVGYVAATVLLPALAFGFLFWKRGFATALVAHAATLLAVAFMI